MIAAAVLIGFLISRAETDYSGGWSGYITQKSSMALASNYRFTVSLQVRDGEVSGHTEIRMWDEPDIYGIMDLEGTVNGCSLELKETEITRQQIYSYAYWCLKFLKLQYATENGKEVLTGHWTSETCSGPGDVYLERSPSV